MHSIVAGDNRLNAGTLGFVAFDSCIDFFSGNVGDTGAANDDLGDEVRDVVVERAEDHDEGEEMELASEWMDDGLLSSSCRG